MNAFTKTAPCLTKLAATWLANLGSQGLWKGHLSCEAIGYIFKTPTLRHLRKSNS